MAPVPFGIAPRREYTEAEKQKGLWVTVGILASVFTILTLALLWQAYKDKVEGWMRRWKQWKIERWSRSFAKKTAAKEAVAKKEAAKGKMPGTLGVLGSLSCANDLIEVPAPAHLEGPETDELRPITEDLTKKYLNHSAAQIGAKGWFV
jgi:hypothetical protein